MTDRLYDPTIDKRAFYAPGDNGRATLLHAKECAALDAALIGLLPLFRGPGENPTGLQGYASNKVWLRQEIGVQPVPGDLLVWSGTAPASDHATWVPFEWSAFQRLVATPVSTGPWQLTP